MERVLKDIDAMTGVIGSFVCDEEGRPLASSLPDIYDQDLLTMPEEDLMTALVDYTIVGGKVVYQR